MKHVKELIDRYVAEGIPYIDARIYHRHTERLRYANGRTPVSGKERLFMYSCTKPVTMCTLMTLVDAGKLTLDTPICDILPAYAKLRMADGSRPRTALTVRHLMTMTGGYDYDITRCPYREELSHAGGRTATRAIVDALAEAPLLSVPGEHFQYSLCHDILGGVIEAVSGMRFGEYMKRAVLEPCGMHDTRFAVCGEDAVAPQYTVHAQGEVVEVAKRCDFVFADGYESGGAGLVSTVDDYSKFATMLAAGGVSAQGKRIVSENSLRQLRTPHVDTSRGFTCIQVSQGNGYAYGLGVRVRTEASDFGLPVGEWGWDGAAGSYLMIDPKHEVAVVVGMHLLNWPEKFSGQHLQIVRRLYEAADIK